MAIKLEFYYIHVTKTNLFPGKSGGFLVYIEKRITLNNGNGMLDLNEEPRNYEKKMENLLVVILFFKPCNKDSLACLPMTLLHFFI